MDILSILFDTIRVATFQPLPRPSGHVDRAAAGRGQEDRASQAGTVHCKSLPEASSTADGAREGNRRIVPGHGPSSPARA